MIWLHMFAALLCMFSAGISLAAWVVGNSEIGLAWGPRWYAPVGWLPMVVFAAWNALNVVAAHG